MKRARPLAVLMAAVAVGLMSACGPQRVRTPEQPGRTVVVLLPDPDRGTVGRAVVSNASGTVELAMAQASTSVRAGQPPARVVVMADSEVQARFADVFSALPPSPRDFILYFRFESDELTSESRALVLEVLKAVMGRSAPDVFVVGHTDTAGTPASNFELGLKRANMVRQFLLEAGVEESLISVASHGEAELLVPTADGTFEPRNRRAQVTVR